MPCWVIRGEEAARLPFRRYRGPGLRRWSRRMIPTLKPAELQLHCAANSKYDSRDHRFHGRHPQTSTGKIDRVRLSQAIACK